MDFHWGIAFFFFGKKVIPVESRGNRTAAAVHGDQLWKKISYICVAIRQAAQAAFGAALTWLMPGCLAVRTPLR